MKIETVASNNYSRVIIIEDFKTHYKLELTKLGTLTSSLRMSYISNIFQ